jgi:hypothetical protein
VNARCQPDHGVSPSREQLAHGGRDGRIPLTDDIGTRMLRQAALVSGYHRAEDCGPAPPPLPPRARRKIVVERTLGLAASMKPSSCGTPHCSG